MSSKESVILKSTELLLESEILLLKTKVDFFSCRLSVLEAVASLVGGWDIHKYNLLFNKNNPFLDGEEALRVAKNVIHELNRTEIPTALALAALAREPISKSNQKSSGAYYTDWRLAQILAKKTVSKSNLNGLWVDPACGSGTLLVAALLEAEKLNLDVESLISNSITGADLSDIALRGSRLSISSMAKDLNSICNLNLRLLHQDSLQSRNTWSQLAPTGFALVIGNPPWEKLKVTRHDLALRHGNNVSYGEKFEQTSSFLNEIANSRDDMLDYVEKVASGNDLQGKGESDLYKLFMELGLAITSEHGVLGLLVPAGLIRSQGTFELRKVLMEKSSSLDITVLENRQRHFDIDTRFKFLIVSAEFSKEKQNKFDLQVADRNGKLGENAISISKRVLATVRPDFSIPEVRTTKEWNLFKKLSLDGSTMNMDGSPWAASFVREVDMTNDSDKFKKTRGAKGIPVIEGRHVSQYRFRSKSYVKGGGRSAVWTVEDRRTSIEIHPQWWIDDSKLKPSVRSAIRVSRIGFCDISGQTNERTLLAARIPGGNVCGNKVPTIRFQDNSVEREDLFLGFANSFVVDWMLRRQVTTTINFFIMESLVFPNLDIDSDISKRIIRLVRKVSRAEGNEKVSHWSLGVMRAQIDALVATAYGLKISDLKIILEDFPLLDRGQPVDNGEKSCLTADLVSLEFSKLNDLDTAYYGARVAMARRIGATPYLPADYAQGDE